MSHKLSTTVLGIGLCLAFPSRLLAEGDELGAAGAHDATAGDAANSDPISKKSVNSKTETLTSVNVSAAHQRVRAESFARIDDALGIDSLAIMNARLAAVGGAGAVREEDNAISAAAESIPNAKPFRNLMVRLLNSADLPAIVDSISPTTKPEDTVKIAIRILRGVFRAEGGERGGPPDLALAPADENLLKADAKEFHRLVMMAKTDVKPAIEANEKGAQAEIEVKKNQNKKEAALAKSKSLQERIEKLESEVGNLKAQKNALDQAAK